MSYTLDKKKKIENSFIRLEPLDVDDYDLFCSAFTCERTMKFIKDKPSRKSIEKNFEIALKDYKIVYFSVSLNENNKKVGFVGVSIVSENPVTIELGFVLLSKLSPKGVALSAAQLMLDYYFSSKQIQQAKFVTPLENVAALRVCRALGVDYSRKEIAVGMKIGYIGRNQWRYERKINGK